MAVAGMNHFTVLTDDLDRVLAFYDEHLGLKPGARQLFFHDPNGAKIEIDFDPAEAAPA
ncbi:MAG: hypothetical protein EPN19_06580 [Betaproteobacteria bacterium]|nr:MAG: hypothetical protein EPN19_06580 [Betaproteobacteria bacterium]